MATKDIKVGALLTITTGIVMVERFEGVGEAFEWIMGHPVFTHEMPMLRDEARARVVRQIADFPTKATSENWRVVLAETVSNFGETVAIEEGDALRIADPLTTLALAMEGRGNGEA